MPPKTTESARRAGGKPSDKGNEKLPRHGAKTTPVSPSKSMASPRGKGKETTIETPRKVNNGSKPPPAPQGGKHSTKGSSAAPASKSVASPRGKGKETTIETPRKINNGSKPPPVPQGGKHSTKGSSAAPVPPKKSGSQSAPTSPRGKIPTKPMPVMPASARRGGEKEPVKGMGKAPAGKAAAANNKTDSTSPKRGQNAPVQSPRGKAATGGKVGFPANPKAAGSMTKAPTSAAAPVCIHKHVNVKMCI
jgi:hypothetical protein